MIAPASGRWFRFAFSLRTLFVIVASFACWLGWEIHIVRHRAVLLARARVAGVGYDDDAEGDRPTLPFWRMWLGDKPIDFIFIPPDKPVPELAELRRAFPEAKFMYFEPSPAAAQPAP